MSEQPYILGETGLHTIQQLRRHIQIFLEQPELNASTTQTVLLMELLLHMYDRLDSIDSRLIALIDKE